MRLRELIARFPYRLDTNFAKMDRIVHPDIEAFKTRVSEAHIEGLSVLEWSNLLSKGSDNEIRAAMERHLRITGRHP
jgi:hypothetical protein